MTRDKGKKKYSILADQLLAETLFPESDDKKKDQSASKKDPLASQVWRMYTKAKDNLPNGSRLENITWRMMAMTLKNRPPSKETEEMSIDTEEKPKENADSPCTTDAAAAAAVDIKSQHPTTPPPPDDTVGLLSSSAPPYTFDFMPPETAAENVLISGSSLAENLHRCTVCVWNLAALLYFKFIKYLFYSPVAGKATCWSFTTDIPG